MDPKQALQHFLDYSKDSLNRHMNQAVQEGKLAASDAKRTLDNFEDRSNLILETFDREAQKGGALKLPGKGMPKLGNAMGALKTAPSPEEIQADIDRLINFDPAESISPTVKPILNTGLSVLIPEVRDRVKKFFGLFFLMGSLEKLPIFGPLIQSALDVSTAFTPALAATIQNMLPNIVGLAPIPYAALIGEAAGYVFSSAMMFFTLMTQVSRGEFLEALEAGAGLVPVLGTTLMMYVNKGKKVYDKLMASRERVLVSLAQIKGLILYLLPMISKKAAKLLGKALPIFDILLKSTASYLVGPANLILQNLKPVMESAKARLGALEKAELAAAAVAAKGGRRYTRRTRRIRHRNRKSRRQHSAK